MSRSLIHLVLTPSSLLAFLFLPLIAMAAPAERRQFWVVDSTTRGFERIEAELRFDGRFARIWVDTRETGLDAEKVGTIARALDTATPAGSIDPSRGIIEIEQELFGKPPSYFQVDGKDDFLLTDLPDPYQGLSMLGYFRTKDQRTAAEMQYSNERNLLYIDSREAMKNMERLLGTIAHEYQHLIHYARNKRSETFFNEGCSQLAALLCGFPVTDSLYLAETNVPLFRWIESDAMLSQGDYQRSTALMLYLYEQFGKRFLYELASADRQGMERIDQALATLGRDLTTTNWRTALRGFAVANYLRSRGAGPYRYDKLLSATMRARVASAIIPPVSEREEVEFTLEPYAAAYQRAVPDKNLRLRIGGNGEYAVLAILTHGDSIQVLELEDDYHYTLGSRELPFDDIVLAYVSLSDRRIEVWGDVRKTTGQRDSGTTGMIGNTDH